MENNMNDYLEFSKDNPFGSQAKMLYHIDRLNEYISTGDTFPVFMEVSLTDICNMKCEWCITANRSNYTLQTEDTIRFLTDFKSLGGKAITYSGGGEPTLHKDFELLSNHAHNVGLDLGLMTNGLFKQDLVPMIGNLYKWVRISLDTVNEEKYKKWKGVTNINRILKNIELLCSTNTKVGINCNVGMDMDVKDIQDLIDATLGQAAYIQFRPILPRYFKEEVIQINKTVWDYLEQFKNNPKINLSIDKFKDLTYNNSFPFRTCEGHFFNPVLNSDGNIKICIYHPGKEDFTFGNIYENSLSEIWQSEKRKKAIEFVRGLDYKNKCQVCCKLYEINKIIDFIKNPSDSLDINFL